MSKYKNQKIPKKYRLKAAELFTVRKHDSLSTIMNFTTQLDQLTEAFDKNLTKDTFTTLAGAILEDVYKKAVAETTDSSLSDGSLSTETTKKTAVKKTKKPQDTSPINKEWFVDEFTNNTSGMKENQFRKHMVKAAGKNGWCVFKEFESYGTKRIVKLTNTELRLELSRTIPELATIGDEV